MGSDGLRPLERRVKSLSESGHDDADIARRFRKSPQHISRIRDLAGLPRRDAASPAGGLRPLERRVLRWLEKGLSFDEIGRLFRRSGAYIERVAGLAQWKKDGSGR